MPAFLLLGLFICVVAATFDLTRGTIPNRLTVPLIVVAPVLHLGVALARGSSLRIALSHGAASLLGSSLCALIPLVMWRKKALGGGDLKLFAGLGGLLFWRIGIELELGVFLVAALVTPAIWAYQGGLLRVLGSVARRAFAIARLESARPALDPALLASLRLGPCFAVAFCFELLLHWRSF